MMANGLQGRGHEVSILTLCGPQEPFYPLAESVRLVALGIMSASSSLWGALQANARRLRVIGRALRQVEPDVLVSSMTETNVLALVATRLVAHLPCPVAVWEQNYPPLQELAHPWPAARKMTYPFADAVVPCGLALSEWFERWLPKDKIFPIQNPVLLEDREPDAHAESVAREIAAGSWILAMGRLVRQKGFDLLLEAFARLPLAEREGWKLGIIGEGPLRHELNRQIEALGLEGRAVLLGRFANPLPLLRACKLFALSSRHEGLPLALQEALACGVPAVCFDCQVGPAEVVRHEVDGLLVPSGDIDAFSAAMARLMRDAGLRRKLAGAAPAVLDRFSLDGFIRRWETLIRSLTPGARGSAIPQVR